jgi:hypothetical protein
VNKVFPDLIPQILAATDTTLRNSLIKLRNIISCSECYHLQIHKIIFGGILPRLVSLITSSDHEMQIDALLMIYWSVETTGYHANAVVQENAILPLIDILRTKDDQAVEISAECISLIYSGCPLVRGPMLTLVLEPMQHALNMPLNTPGRSAHPTLIQLLTSCLKDTNHPPDPELMVNITRRIIELIPKAGTALIGAVLLYLAQVVEGSHNYPAVLDLVFNESLLQHCIQLLPTQTIGFVFFKAVLKCDPSMGKKMDLAAILTSAWLTEHSAQFLLQLLEDKKTVKENLKLIADLSIVRAALISPDAPTQMTLQFLLKFFSEATDDQVRANLPESVAHQFPYSPDKLCLDTLGVVLERITNTIGLTYEEREMFAKEIKQLKFQFQSGNQDHLVALLDEIACKYVYYL